MFGFGVLAEVEAFGASQRKIPRAVPYNCNILEVREVVEGFLPSWRHDAKAEGVLRVFSSWHGVKGLRVRHVGVEDSEFQSHGIRTWDLGL